MSHLLLIGFMGSGKSTVGRILAHERGLPFVDLDARIVARAGMTIPEIFASGGEERFRELETAVLGELADAPDAIVACGGGVVVRDENRSILKSLGRVVYLRVTAGEAIARIGDTSSRPLLAGPGASLAATSLLAAREALYTAVADVTVETEGYTPQQVADRVSEELNA